MQIISGIITLILVIVALMLFWEQMGTALLAFGIAAIFIWIVYIIVKKASASTGTSSDQEGTTSQTPLSGSPSPEGLADCAVSSETLLKATGGNACVTRSTSPFDGCSDDEDDAIQRIHERGQELDYAFGAVPRSSSPEAEALEEANSEPHLLPADPVPPSHKSSQPASYVVLDFETTGFSPTANSIIEYGIVKFEHGVEIGSISGFVNPGKKIPSRITQLTGITDADVFSAPDIVTSANAIYHFIGMLPIVAHNAPFDIDFLLEAYDKVGITTELSFIDTLPMARKAFPGAPNYKLSTLILWLSIDGAQEHRALSDVYFTNELFKKCVEKCDATMVRYVPPPTLSGFELDVATWVKTTLTSAGIDTQYLSFACDTRMLRVNCYYCAARFKLNGKLRYAIVPSEYVPQLSGVELSPCSKAEGGENMRLRVESIADLSPYAKVLIAEYQRTHAFLLSYIADVKCAKKKVANYLAESIVL